jgi:hypothetical protein
MVIWVVPAHLPLSGGSSKFAHRASLLRDNPAGDIRLPKIRMCEVRALSHDGCDRLLRIVGTNPSPLESQRQGTPFNRRQAPGNCPSG